MDKLVISIVTWNHQDSIENCIQSVLDQTHRDFVLHIVDNNSHDQTCSRIETFNDPRIRLTKLKANTGFCGGNNLTINSTQSEYVLLVNPDVVMKPDYIERALQTMNEDVRTGTVCGLLMQGDPDDQDTSIDGAGLTMMRSRIFRVRFHGKKKQEVELKKEIVFGADGALPLYRRAMINDISFEGDFFDEMFFAHKEDWDVSWRSHSYGWNTVFDPACVAIHPRHFKPASFSLRKTVSAHIKIHTVKNSLILILKNESLPSLLLNSIFILPRQVTIFLFIALFERTSLKAYGFVWKNFAEIMKKRREIQRRRTR